MKKVIKIGGEERPVLFSKNALADFEKVLGKSIFEADMISVETVRALLYVGLKWGLYDPAKGIEPKAPYTLIQVGDLMDEKSFIDDDGFVEVITLYNDSFPKKAKAGSDPASGEK